MSWQASDARSKFGSLLDTAEAEGPQLIRRGGRRFVLLTEEELERRFAAGPVRPGAKFINAWETLRVPPHTRLTEEESAEFERVVASCRGR
jgi:prevent-host-death family protein